MAYKNLKQLIEHLKTVETKVGGDTEIRIEGMRLEDDLENYIDVNPGSHYIDFIKS